MSGVIPRKHRRRMVLDGRPYVWSLPAHKPRYHWEEPTPPHNGATLTVQADSGSPGRVAQVSMSWREGRAITPEVVAIVIRWLLEAGWNPSHRGAAFVMDAIALEDLDTRDKIARDVMES